HSCRGREARGVPELGRRGVCHGRCLHDRRRPHFDPGGMSTKTGGKEMRPSKRRVAALAACLLIGALTATAALASSRSAKAAGGNITVWLSGTYAGATPGSTCRKWVDSIAARYKAKFPGSSVKFVLTPINNDQFTAQI